MSQLTHTPSRNARLTEAAPHLLACLKSAERAIRMVAAILRDQKMPESAEELRKHAAIYAEVIAKAEGKAEGKA